MAPAFGSPSIIRTKRVRYSCCRYVVKRLLKVISVMACIFAACYLFAAYTTWQLFDGIVADLVVKEKKPTYFQILMRPSFLLPNF